MQTFVTYFSHPKTMADLDDARLGKQRLETLQILRTLRGESINGAWQNHPAVQMWEGYEPALVLYGLFVCHEWRIVRKHNDTIWGDLADIAIEYKMMVAPSSPETNYGEVENPPWLQDKWVLRSHRSNLMRKAPHIYGPKYDGTPENMPYLWPKIDHFNKIQQYDLYISKPDLARLENGDRILPEDLRLQGHFVIPEENS